MLCVQHGFTYFQSQFSSQLSQLQDYAYPVQLLSSILIVDGLRVLVKDEAMILGLKEKLPIYLAAASYVAPETDPLFWWNHHEQDLPNWVSLVCHTRAALVCSSGACIFCSF